MDRQEREGRIGERGTDRRGRDGQKKGWTDEGEERMRKRDG
ncbi:hypothetical protein FACS189472_14010 [Alphaproteobacteria bacterium]|nr:hypothetical protein FACS189472_14010 [Alphaproteobacteria bacterium]